MTSFCTQTFMSNWTYHETKFITSSLNLDFNFKIVENSIFVLSMIHSRPKTVGYVTKSVFIASSTFYNIDIYKLYKQKYIMFLFLYTDFEKIIISAILNQKCRHSKRNL